MSIRVRVPATERLELTQGDWLIVKQYLTAGETRELMRASSRALAVPIPDAGAVAAAPRMELDPLAAMVAIVLAYLLDWSFQGADGKPLVIAHQPANVVRAALDHRAPDAFQEVLAAITTHDGAMRQAIADEKKTMSNGAIDSDKTLTSVG